MTISTAAPTLLPTGMRYVLIWRCCIAARSFTLRYFFVSVRSINKIACRSGVT